MNDERTKDETLLSEEYTPSRIKHVSFLQSPGKWLAHEYNHYKAGFKLLVADVKIAWRMFKKVMSGQTLTRRERKQFVRTTADVMRVFPLAVFLIVPGLEFALPFAIKIYPNLLPSQFEDKDKKESERRKVLKVRIEMAKFLTETMEDITLTTKSEENQQRKEELESFF